MKREIDWPDNDTRPHRPARRIAQELRWLSLTVKFALRMAASSSEGIDQISVERIYISGS